jgi:hypothetical protein
VPGERVVYARMSAAKSARFVVNLVGGKRIGKPLRRESSKVRSLPACDRDVHRSIGFQPVFCGASERDHVLMQSDVREAESWVLVHRLEAYAPVTVR